MSGTKGLRHSLFLLSFVTRLSSKKNSTGIQSVSRMHFRKNALWLNYFTEFSWKKKKKFEGLGLDSSWGLTTFSLSHARDKTEKILLHFFTELKNFQSLFLVTNMTLSTLQYAGCVSHEPHNRHRSPLSLCNSVGEHRCAKSKSLRFDSWGLRSFCLLRSWQDEKHLFLKKNRLSLDDNDNLSCECRTPKILRNRRYVTSSQNRVRFGNLFLPSQTDSQAYIRFCL